MQIVDGKDYLSEVKDLIIEYSKRLSRDLSFQNIDEELHNTSETIMILHMRLNLLLNSGKQKAIL